MKTLYILTGPPGSGKTSHAAQVNKQREFFDLPTVPIYDVDLGNKDEWSRCTEDCILCTAAPSAGNKRYWVDMATHFGFTPVLLVMWCPRMVALQRMEQRSGLTKWERNDLHKSVERWYKKYDRHPQEQRIPTG